MVQILEMWDGWKPKRRDCVVVSLVSPSEVVDGDTAVYSDVGATFFTSEANPDRMNATIDDARKWASDHGVPTVNVMRGSPF